MDEDFVLVGPNDWEASRFRDGSQDLAGVPDSAADQEDHRFETASLSGLAAGPPAAKQGRLAQPDASKGTYETGHDAQVQAARAWLESYNSRQKKENQWPGPLKMLAMAIIMCLYLYILGYSCLVFGEWLASFSVPGDRKLKADQQPVPGMVRVYVGYGAFNISELARLLSGQAEVEELQTEAADHMQDKQEAHSKHPGKIGSMASFQHEAEPRAKLLANNAAFMKQATMPPAPSASPASRLLQLYHPLLAESQAVLWIETGNSGAIEFKRLVPAQGSMPAWASKRKVAGTLMLAPAVTAVQLIQPDSPAMSQTGSICKAISSGKGFVCSQGQPSCIQDESEQQHVCYIALPSHTALAVAASA